MSSLRDWYAKAALRYEAGEKLSEIMTKEQINVDELKELIVELRKATERVKYEGLLRDAVRELLDEGS